MTDRPRILFLAPVSYFKGGAERSLFDLLRNPGIVPLLAVPAEGPLAAAARDEGIPVSVVPYGAITDITRPVRLRTVLRAVRDWGRAAAALTRLARAERADIVHSNGLKAHCVAGLAKALGAGPAIFHVRDIAVQRSERLLWRLLARVATRMLIVSRACWPGETLPPKVIVVPNGLVLPPPLPTREDRGEGPLRIGCCGRIHPFKGIHVLLGWFAEAVAQGFDAVLLVRGETAPEAADYVDRLKARAAALGIAERVRFEGRFEGLAAIYGGLDLVVVPSDTPDPLPRTVMEAMGLGMPVIGYPAGGIPDMITNGVDGWLAGSAGEFIAALRAITTDAALLERVSRAARSTIAERFTLAALHARLDAIYATILSHRSS